MSTGDPICKHGTWWHNCRRCNTDTGIPIGEDDKMLNQDMRERHVEESHHTCGFHKKNPGQQYAGCTCSGSYSLVLGSPPTPTPELSDSHPMTESGKQELSEDRHTANGPKWNCRFHPTDWWHEVGCPHKTWTNDELWKALVTAKQGAEAAAIAAYRSEHEAEVEGLRKKLLDWEEREAAICVEDRGFEETITTLRNQLREAYEAIATHFMAAHPVENGPGTYTACQFCGASGENAFDVDHYDDCLVRKSHQWIFNNTDSSEEDDNG